MRNNYKSKITKLLVLTIFGFTLPPIHNTSALSYKNNIGIGFTFSPTLSVSLSSSDLTISSLTPGTTSESNSIEVSVATNAAYGYILTTSVGNNTIYNSTDLIHSNSNNIFSSIPANTSLSSLEDSNENNIWGYSYKLSSSNAWSNYSGLPLYNNPLKVLLNTDNNNEVNNSIDFKITAKASSTQTSGEYSNVINFSAITKPTPTTLAEAYANYYQATNRTMHNGYYVMQDMSDSHICENTEVIGSELQVIDIRDDKVYWIAKLADGKCWMTQNLDLNLSSEVSLTSGDTDLNDAVSPTYQNGYNTNNSIITYVPLNNTIDATTTYPAISGWNTKGNTEPYSAEIGNIYIDPNTGAHGLSGNYYNWTAAIASNNSTSEINDNFNNAENNPKNSICPKGWRLPIISSTLNEFTILNTIYNNKLTNTDIGLKSPPLYFIKSGRIYLDKFQYINDQGQYWSSTTFNESSTYYLFFTGGYISLQDKTYYPKNTSASIRCLSR